MLKQNGRFEVLPSMSTSYKEINNEIFNIFLKMHCFIISWITILHFVFAVNCQLIVNVKNNGGDVYRENINANTTQDTVGLEFRKADGTIVTQFIDGKNEVQIFKVVILPEEERGQTQVQTMCFVSRFAKNEFISSDAMSKLRQKNPSAIRHPEESRPEEYLSLDLLLNVATSHVLSPHIASLCSDAAEMTYTADGDLRLISQILNRDYQILQAIVHPAPLDSLPSCQAVHDPSQPCLCHYTVCVGWYPCGLKYCRGKDSANRVVSYRCGIKTCSKCRSFDFAARLKSFCIWDEPEFDFDFESQKSSVETGQHDQNVAPVPEGVEQEVLVVPIVLGSSQPVVKMEQKVVEKTDEGKKEVNAIGGVVGLKTASDGKASVIGKSAPLDDDEDGE